MLEGFPELALSFQSFAPCEAGVIICYEKEELGAIVPLDSVWTLNVDMYEVTNCFRLTSRGIRTRARVVAKTGQMAFGSSLICCSVMFMPVLTFEFQHALKAEMAKTTMHAPDRVVEIDSCCENLSGLKGVIYF